MSDFDPQLAVDATFDAFGKVASYTPTGGTAVACTVIKDSEDRFLSGFEGKPMLGGTVIEVRATEVAAPAKAGTFLVDAVTYTIADDPQTADPERLVWRCTVR
jgi:hypothetical protein